MKFLAILKDSLREAIDTKVFYVMVALSTLLIGLAFTLSFKPRKDERMMQLFAVSLFVDNPRDLDEPDRLMKVVMAPDFRAYEIVSAVPRDGAPEGPDSPYHFTLVAHCKTPDEADKIKANPAEVITRVKERFGKLEDMVTMEVTDVKLASPDAPAVPKTPDDKDVYLELDGKPTTVARRLWAHEPSLFFGALPISFLGEVPLGLQLYWLEDKIVNGIGAWVSILISIIITAFFIPNMLRKGTVDLLIVKPIHRTTLLLYKYVGGLIFIFLNTSFAICGMWLAVGLRSGVWAPSFLLTIFVITSFFGILYSVSTLFAVLTRSPIVAILLTGGVWFVLWAVGAINGFSDAVRKEEKARAAEVKIEKEDGKPAAGPKPQGRPRPDLPFSSDNWFFNSVRVIHFVLPRTHDLDALSSQLLIRDLLTANQIKMQKTEDDSISWGESLTVSGVFVVVMLGISCFWFATKDY